MRSLLVDRLYAYALDNRLDRHFTDGEEEYLSCQHYSQLHLERLTALLNDAARREWEAYTQEQEIVDCYRQEALFYAGLAVGLALARLG